MDLTMNRTPIRYLRRGIFLAAALLIAHTASTPAHAAPRATVCDASQYGAAADGKTKDTRAIQAAIDDCEHKGGGTVRLRGGTFLSGPIVLKSHITLEVDEGAVLLASSDHDDYPLMTVLRDQGRQSLISATNAEEIVIDGGGTIDGAGETWWEEARGQKEHGVMGAGVFRPRLMVFDHCRHILIENVTVQNSPSWQIVPYYSDDVTIRNGRILAPAHSPNTDGIDPFSSHHVTIAHMTIDVGDDNVAIKSGQPGSPGPDDPSTDITVTDCVFLHGHGLSIGSEVAGGVENVRASRIQFQGTANGVRIKSNRDRGADIGNLDFRDITMQDVATPLLITEYYPHIPEHDVAQPVTRLTPHFHDIRITNLKASGAQEGGVIQGLPESPIMRIVLDHVQISGQKGLSIGNATVTAHELTVQATEGAPVVLLDHGTLDRK
jgi:polygalacturonase